MRRLCILYVMLFETSVYSLPSGAPSQACSSLTPNHGGSSQSSPLPYTLNMSTFNFYNDGNSYYEPGNTYQCKENCTEQKILRICMKKLRFSERSHTLHTHTYTHCIHSVMHGTVLLSKEPIAIYYSLFNSNSLRGHISRIFAAGKATDR